VPEGAFEVLVRQSISRLLEPSLDCAYEVNEELRKIVINIKIPELSKYYRLESKICDVMEGVLDKCLNPTTEMIANFRFKPVVFRKFRYLDIDHNLSELLINLISAVQRRL
jgi:hypothetical protein